MQKLSKQIMLKNALDPQDSTIWMLRFAILSFCFIVLGSSKTLAQPYVWSHTHTSSAECVTFNPLSKGKTIYFASLNEKGIFRSDDGGMTWLQYWVGMQEFSSSGLMQIHCLESDTNILLAVSTSYGIYRSTNGGQTWSLALEPGGILGEAITWHRPTDVLYYGQNYKGPVWKSVDHGATWVQSGEASDEVVLCTISISQDERKRILAGSGEGGIALTTTEGASWITVFPEENPDEIIRPEVPKIIWSTHAPDVILATRWLSQDSQLIRSLDGGETWSTIGMDLPRTWALEFDQRFERAGSLGPKRFWVGLFNRGLEPNEVHSVIETHDEGKTWIGTGIPEVQQVWMLKHDTTSDRLIAATNLGIFVTTAKSSVDREEHEQLVQFTNNPARNNTEVLLPAQVAFRSLDLHDASGRRILSVHSKQIRVSDLANGSYNALVRTSNGDYYLPLIVQH